MTNKHVRGKHTTRAHRKKHSLSRKHRHSTAKHSRRHTRSNNRNRNRANKHRGGNICETTSGAANGACFPNDGLLNGPYGFIPLHNVAGLYPAQI